MEGVQWVAQQEKGERPSLDPTLFRDKVVFIAGTAAGLYDLRVTPFSAATLRKADCVVIVTNHAAFDYKMIAREAKVIVDTRNALKGHSGRKIVKL